MNHLPAGWAWSTLGEIADTTLGKMLDRGKSGGHPEVPYLRNVNVQWGRIDTNDLPTMELPSDQLEFFSLRPGDLLACEGGEIGRAAVWPGSDRYVTFQKALHRIRPLGDIKPDFLLLYLRWMSDSGQLVEYATGSTIKHLPQQMLRALPIALPPLAEQRRIVEALKEARSRSDFGNKLLKSAVERSDLAVQAVKDAVYDLAVAEASRLEPLSQIASEPMRNGVSGRATSEAGGLRTLTLTAVTKNDFSDRNTKLAGINGRDVADLWLKDGDILVQRSNTPELVGTSATYHGADGWAVFPDLMIRIRVKDQYDPDYVQAILSSRRVHDVLRGAARGLAGSMPKIDQGTLGRSEIPVLGLEQQRRLLHELKAQEADLCKLARQCRALLGRAELLERALLSAAFHGELVTADPHDEPASALLGRIRAERSTVPRGGRRRGPTRSTAP